MQHENGAYTLTKADCKALLSCISHDTSRDFLNAVFFEPKTGSVVTTDGHTLMHAESAAKVPDVKPYLVPREAFEKAVRFVSRASTDLLHVTILPAQPPTFEDRLVVMVVDRQPKTGSREELARIECGELKKQFPPSFRQVIPKLEATPGSDLVNIAFNPQYIKRACLMADACDPRVYGVRWQLPYSELDPIRATCSNPKEGITWVCVVMPIRVP